MTLDNLHKLADVGVFNPSQMNEAISQFPLFERASLNYLGTTGDDAEPARVGLWDQTASSSTVSVST